MMSNHWQHESHQAKDEGRLTAPGQQYSRKLNQVAKIAKITMGKIWWITTNSTKIIWWKMTFCYKKFGGIIDSIYIWT